MRVPTTFLSQPIACLSILPSLCAFRSNALHMWRLEMRSDTSVLLQGALYWQRMWHKAYMGLSRNVSEVSDLLQNRGWKRRILKLKDRVRRWSLEGGRWKASIEQAEDDIRIFNGQIIQQEGSDVLSGTIMICWYCQMRIIVRLLGTSQIFGFF